MTAMIIAALLNIISVAFGTFAANFTILWIIGNQAKALEKKQMEIAIEQHNKVVERVREDIKKKQEYMRMES